MRPCVLRAGMSTATLDPQLRRLLERIAEQPNATLTFAETDTPNVAGLERAQRLGYVTDADDGGGWGVTYGYRLTRKGAQALGIESPSVIDRLLRRIIG
jgi:hypothetical protein